MDSGPSPYVSCAGCIATGTATILTRIQVQIHMFPHAGGHRHVSTQPKKHFACCASWVITELSFGTAGIVPGADQVDAGASSSTA